jgi:nucleoside-diphosphate-sugar epimerase
MQRESHRTRLIIGCGFLGQRIARLWRDQAGHVVATTRTPGHAVDKSCRHIVCDVLQKQTLRDLPRADTVVFAVGYDRTSGVPMRSVYVDGLANVLEILPAPGKFLYISSGSVYGQTAGDWVNEESPTVPQEDAGKVVLDAENVLHKHLAGAVTLRFGGIYGPGRLLRRKTLEAGVPIVGDGDKWLNLIHVEDGARAVLAAEAGAPPGRIYNVCDGGPVRRRDFYTALARHLGAPAPQFVAPPAGQPLPPHESANRRLSNERLVNELNFKFRYEDYQAGIKFGSEPEE